LTIHGHGFNNPNVSVTVAGVNCLVTQYQEESVSCELQPTTVPTLLNASWPDNGTIVGAHGVRRRFINSTSVNWNNIGTFATYEDHLFTSFEVPTN
jgi:hypothetical protein